ncbi:MAG: DAK2 domain-containing protein [Clostridiales bacterium]|nr:DAK2 domain-containing protein [Clostridiales bacterium]
MKFEYIDGALLKEMLLLAAKNLEDNKARINEMNVYPVPDGDTGTNMSLTIQSSVREVMQVKDVTVANICSAISRGALKGARGNSGVILSQLFRGFVRAVDGKQSLTIADMALALKEASVSAYKAIMKPSEGTILTVARVVGERAMEVAPLTTDFETFFDAVVAAGKNILNQTPEMLPTLKQAGVVDAGGMGYYCILSGFAMAFKENAKFSIADYATAGANDSAPNAFDTFVDDHDPESINFAYCTEFFVYEDENVLPADIEDIFKAEFGPKGDCMLVIYQDGIVKTHIHTNDPLSILGFAMKFGVLQDVKVENMRLQNAEVNAAKKKAAPKKKYGIVAVALGDGIRRIFKDLTVDVIVSGGQTMNPSTDDIVRAIEKCNAECVFVLPNNKNIVMAATQAKELCECDVRVIPTRSTAQGISVLVSFDPDASADKNESQLVAALDNVTTGQITYSIKDTMINDIQVKQGDYIALVNGKLKASSKVLEESVRGMIENMVTEDSYIATVYYGEDVSEADANKIAQIVEEAYPDIEVEVYHGGQPVYYYMIAVE